MDGARQKKVVRRPAWPERLRPLLIKWGSLPTGWRAEDSLVFNQSICETWRFRFISLNVSIILIRLMFTKKKTFCDEIISTLFCCICRLPPPGTMEIVVALKASNALATCLHRSKRIIINKSDSPDRGARGDNFGDGRCDLAPVQNSRLDVGQSRTDQPISKQTRNNKRQQRNQRQWSNKSKQTDPRCLHTEGQGVDMPL